MGLLLNGQYLSEPERKDGLVIDRIKNINVVKHHTALKVQLLMKGVE